MNAHFGEQILFDNPAILLYNMVNNIFAVESR